MFRFDAARDEAPIADSFDGITRDAWLSEDLPVLGGMGNILAVFPSPMNVPSESVELLEMMSFLFSECAASTWSD